MDDSNEVCIEHLRDVAHKAVLFDCGDRPFLFFANTLCGRGGRVIGFRKLDTKTCGQAKMLGQAPAAACPSLASSAK